MANKREKYGLRWEDTQDDLQIEHFFIRKGGFWEKNGVKYGLGLFEHYRRCQKLMWPEDSENRWSNLILQEILNNTITAILGPKDSGKTHCASKYALTDYFCFPNETLILISSTDLRGLEMRVWGDLKDLWERARNRFDWVAGNILESKHALCTDDLEDDGVRDMRKGIICIPCISSGGQFVGLSKYVGLKQKRRRLLADECFPAGSLVATPSGPRRIETLLPGDAVLSAAGTDLIQAVRRSLSKSMMRIFTKDGRRIECTPSHPFLTQQGWKKACELNVSHYMIGLYEAMQILQDADPEQGFLQRELQRKMGHDDARRPGEVLHARAGQQTFQVQRKMASRQPGALGQCDFQNAAFNGGAERRPNQESLRHFESHRPRAETAGRKWHRTHQSGTALMPMVPRRRLEFCGQDRSWERQRFSNVLQSGPGIPDLESGHRGRRPFAPTEFSARPGFEKGHPADGAWVDRVEIYESANIGGRGPNAAGIAVYNLQVQRHHSYSVAGLLVANCQFMRDGFLDSVSNLNSGDFKGVFMGNPIGQDDPLDKVSEPKEGWDAISEPTKTTVWPNRWIDGRTINLIGTDCPNFDFPADQPVKFPYLINKRSIESVVAFYGKESLQYHSQCLGTRRGGLNARRVLTREMCEQFHAFDPVVWAGSKRIKIAACDAAYGGVGGDRCPIGHIEFGEDVDGRTVIACHPPVMVPVSVSKNTAKPEDQIAEFARDYCEQHGVAPENFGFDSTGRGSLGTALARVWSAFVEPVEFGGSATKRPVDKNLFVMDGDGHKRLKLCCEHYRKWVTEGWFSVRYVVEANQMRQLPPDVAKEFYMREWKEVAGGKIEIEIKEETKLRMGRSPDLADWLVTAVEVARRRGFQIERLTSGLTEPAGDDWMQREADDYDAVLKDRLMIHQ